MAAMSAENWGDGDRPQPVRVSGRVHWVGAFDPKLRVFDIILKTANGTSYNAYVVRGSEGVAVVDTVKDAFADDFFARLEQVANYDEIRAIVLNHLEPDHTGALPELMRRAPQARLYISIKAQLMLKALLKAEELAYTPVETGDGVSLGDCELRFLHTPYLHWPDTQCAFLPEDRILFSGDIFGCHFCDERLFNDVCGDFRFSFEYYYAHIMRPFRPYVQAALELIEPLDISAIAPSHGPILRDRPLDYVRRYHELAMPRLRREIPPGERALLIFYISSYGNTARMAEAIGEGARQVAGVRPSLYDLEGGDSSTFADLLEEADAVVIGSPTINGDAVKPVWDLLSSLTMIDVKGKIGAAFGSYGWSGEAVRMIEDRLRGLKLRVPKPGLRIKLIPTPGEIEECQTFGRELGEELMGRRGPRVIDMSEIIHSTHH
ncbi:MAG: FprA family A-type flavoprotein [Methylococcus sp.]